MKYDINERWDESPSKAEDEKKKSLGSFALGVLIEQSQKCSGMLEKNFSLSLSIPVTHLTSPEHTLVLELTQIYKLQLTRHQSSVQSWLCACLKISSSVVCSIPIMNTHHTKKCFWTRKIMRWAFLLLYFSAEIENSRRRTREGVEQVEIFVFHVALVKLVGVGEFQSEFQIRLRKLPYTETG